jgi:hypothetical protein
MKITESQLRRMIRGTLVFERKERDEQEERGGEEAEEDFEGDSSSAATGPVLSGEDLTVVPYSDPDNLYKKVSSNANLNQMQINAWQWLSKYLPAGARMTSGIRTQAEQDTVIRSMAGDRGITGDLDEMTQGLKDAGVVIARNVGRGHGTGEAFDISGADLSQIQRGVEAATSDPAANVKFAPFSGPFPTSIKEDENNAVHAFVQEAGAIGGSESGTRVGSSAHRQGRRARRAAGDAVEDDS